MAFGQTPDDSVGGSIGSWDLDSSQDTVITSYSTLKIYAIFHFSRLARENYKYWTDLLGYTKEYGKRVISSIAPLISGTMYLSLAVRANRLHYHHDPLAHQDAVHFGT
jgi:hypothetical protein